MSNQALLHVSEFTNQWNRSVLDRAKREREEVYRGMGSQSKCTQTGEVLSKEDCSKDAKEQRAESKSVRPI